MQTLPTQHHPASIYMSPPHPLPRECRTQREVQELTGLVSATLASLSLDGEEVGVGGEEEQQEQEEGALGGGSGGEIEAAVGEERGGTGLLAAAGVLRSKVVLLAKKAAAAGEVASQVAEVSASIRTLGM